MIVTLTAAAALLLSIILIFIESIFIKMALIPILIFVIIYSLIVSRKRMKQEMPLELINEEKEDLLQENKRLSARLQEIEGLYRHLLKESNENESSRDSLIDDASYLCTALPLMKELASLVIEKTEESAIYLTENIFQISNKSSKVGKPHKYFFTGYVFPVKKALKRI